MGAAEIRTNRRMDELGLFASPGPDPGVALAPRLADVLRAGFAEVKGCVVLASYAADARRASMAAAGDETGLEAFVNHIHLEDALFSTAEDPGVLDQTRLFAEQLIAKLTSDLPCHRFRVIVTVSDSCTVRFHQERPGQRWLADDLEAYAEAVWTALLNGP